MPAADKKTQDELMQDIHTAWTELQGTQTEFDRQVKALGSANSETIEKLKKCNEGIDAAEAKATALAGSFKAQEDKITSVEAKLEMIREDLARFGNSGAAKKFNNAEGEAKALIALQKQAFMATLRYEGLSRGGAVKVGKSLDEYMGPDLFKALIVGNDEAGGYLAPGEYIAEMIMNQVEWSPIRTVARVRTTTKSSVRMPKRKTTAAASWTAETGDRTQTTNPSFGLLEVTPEEMYAMVQVSFQELEDAAFDIEGFLRAEFAEQFGVTEGAAFVAGDGAGKPKGFTVTSDVGYVPTGFAAKMAADAIIALSYEPKDAYIQNGTFALNRASLRVIRQMKAADGHYLWAPGIALQARPATILDRPYITCPDMASPTTSSGDVYAASAYPIAFADWQRFYMIVDRLAIQFQTDSITAKSSGMMEISARKRVGGQVLIAEAGKLLKVAVS